MRVGLNKWLMFKCQAITSIVILGHENLEFLSKMLPASAEWTSLLPGRAGRASVPSVNCCATCCTMPYLPTPVDSGPKAIFVCLSLIRGMGK